MRVSSSNFSNFLKSNNSLSIQTERIFIENTDFSNSFFDLNDIIPSNFSFIKSFFRMIFLKTHNRVVFKHLNICLNFSKFYINIKYPFIHLK